MDDEDQYKYQRIDLASDTFRLLRLLRGSRGDSIQCELFETFLHQVEGVPYEALSYCWGNSPEAYEVFINERKKHVKQNLYMALATLRQPDEDRLLWIDAICIDQDNHKEKGHQVGQMRQIYENAEQVVIWLGPSNRKIDSLMDLARRWDYQTGQRPRAHHAQGWIDSWINLTADETDHYKQVLRDSLQEMLNRPWFRRVWILQEVASAKRATILCGSKATPSRGFSLLPFLLDLELDSHTQAVLDILPGYRRNETWWGEKPNLETLLLKFWTSEATDQRDNIYALLGIASDARASNTLRPNYEVSLGRAICHTISFLLFDEAYDPSARPLPEDMDFPTFLRILPKLSDHILGWALRTHNDVTAAAVVPKAADINTLYNIKDTTVIPVRSLLSWIVATRIVGFDRTFRAMLERDDVNVLGGSNARIVELKRGQLDRFKLLQHPSDHFSTLTMRSSEILLNYAAGSGDRGIFKRVMSIVTTRNPTDLEQSINKVIEEATKFDGQIIRPIDTDPLGSRVRQDLFHRTEISAWLAHYLMSREGGIKLDSPDEDIDSFFETLSIQVKTSAPPSGYIAMVLASWRLKSKGTPLSFKPYESSEIEFLPPFSGRNRPRYLRTNPVTIHPLMHDTHF